MLTTKQQSNEQLISEQSTQINEIKRSISSIENLLKEQSKRIDESNLIDCSNGFFKYLFDKYKVNPVTRGLININGNCSEGNKRDFLPNILVSGFSSYYNSENEQNSYIDIDFKAFLIKFDKYSLFVGDSSHNQLFNSWILKGITNENKEIILDDVNNLNEITKNNPKITRIIQIKNIPLIKSIHLQMKGKNTKNTYYMCLINIEFFGAFKNTA